MTETELISVHRGQASDLELAAIRRAVTTVLARRGDDQRTTRVELRPFRPPQSWAPARAQSPAQPTR